MKKGVYSDGKRHGQWLIYHDNEQLWKEVNYKNGKLDGYCVLYLTDKNKSIEGQFEDGLETGNWKYWHDNANRDRVGNYHKGKKNGKWTYYFDETDTKWYAVEFKGNRKNGRCTYWHKSESEIIAHTGYFLDDKETGLWEYYNFEGFKYQWGNYVKGEKDGEWVAYHHNKNIQGKGSYIHDENAE